MFGLKTILQIRDDLHSIIKAEGRDLTFKNIIWGIFGLDAFIILMLFRIRKAAVALHIPFVNRFLRGLTLACYGLELGIDVELGTGVNFVHSTGTVVGGKASIGPRTKLYGCNTVGTAKENGEPEIGADVIIGAGARVLGPIEIGHGTIIGANAVVLYTCPSHSKLMGIPAKAQ